VHVVDTSFQLELVGIICPAAGVKYLGHYSILLLPPSPTPLGHYQLSEYGPLVEGLLYCKRPIQCLASSEILTPHPLTARRVCCTPPPPPPLVRGVGHTHIGGEGEGGQ
jgi:hypothetical protein